MRALRPTWNGRYYVVSLYGNGPKIVARVHVLVLEAFGKPRPEGLVSCHGPLGATCNTISNLYWGTHTVNANDRERDGTMMHGSTHHRAKLTETQVLNIRSRLRQGIPYQTLADEYGVTGSLIRHIEDRLIWKHI